MRDKRMRAALRRSAMAVVFAGATLAVLASARGQTTHTIGIVPKADASLLFEGNTYDGFNEALDGSALPSIGLDVPGFQSLSGLSVTHTTDDTHHVVALTAEDVQNLFGDDSPLHAGAVDVQLLGIWDNAASDVTPEIVLGIRAGGLTLEELYRPWETQSADGDTDLGTAVFALAPHAATLDPAALPDEVDDFFALNGRLDLSRKVNLAAKLAFDPASDVIVKAARLLGLDAAELAGDIDLAGPVADDASLVFDRAAGDDTDPDTFRLDASLPAEVPLAPLHDLWNMLGIQFDDEATESLNVLGHLSFTLDAGVDPSLDGLGVELTGPAMTLGAPRPLDQWFVDSLEFPTDAWALGMQFAGDAVTFTATLEGVTTDLLGDPATEPLTLQAIVDVLPDPGQFTAALSASLTHPWHEPLNVPWLTVKNAGITATLSSVPDAAPSVLMNGRFDVGGPSCVSGKDLGITLDIQGTEPPSATLTVALEDTINAGDMVHTVFGCAATLPTSISAAAFGPGTLTVSVDLSGRIRLDSTLTTHFTPYPEKCAADPDGCEIDVDLLLSTDSGGTNANQTTSPPRFTVGVRPESGLMLSDILPAAVQLPTFDGQKVDLPITPDDPEHRSGFGFVYSSAELSFVNDAGLSDLVKGWFAPLYGGNTAAATAGKTVAGSSLSALGSFKLPSPLAELVRTFGVRDHVLLSGTIPLPGSPTNDIAASLALEFDNDVLPSFVNDDPTGAAAGTLELGLAASGIFSGSPSLKMTMGGSLAVRLKQGLEPGVADALAVVGIHAPRANPTSAAVGSSCGRAGSNAIVELEKDSGDNFCYDVIDVGLNATLEFALTPPAVVLGFEGDFDPRGEWAPFGLDDVLIQHLNGAIKMRLEPDPAATPPIKVTLTLGGFGDMTVFDKDMQGAFQAGFSIAPLPPPAFVKITPSPEDFSVRASFPDGIAREDLIGKVDADGNLVAGVQAKAAHLVGANAFGADLIGQIGGAVPDFALRNLMFSMSPKDVPSLCIPAGLKFRADLFIDEADGLEFEGEPECHPATWSPQPSPSDNAQCVDLKEEGCVAGVRLSLTPQGIEADGFLAGQNLRPFPVRFDDALLQLRLTLERQLLKIAGGVDIGLETEPEPWASGKLAIDLKPSKLQFLGRVKVFPAIGGFKALIDAKFEPLGGESPFAIFTGDANPNLAMHVILADDGMPLGSGPSFETRVRSLSADFLEDLEDLAQLLQDVRDRIEDGEYRQTVLDLPDLIEDLDLPVTVPSWVNKIADQLSILEQATDGEETLTLDKILNGFQFDGVEIPKVPEKRSCIGVLYDGDCYGHWQDPVCPGEMEGGKCYALGFTPTPIGGICHLEINDVKVIPWSVEGEDCDVPGDVLDAIEDIFKDGLRAALDFGGSNSRLGQMFDTILAYVNDSSPGPIFDLSCAAASVEISREGDRRAAASLHSTIFAEPLGFDLNWNFDNMAASARSTVEEFFRVLTGDDESPCPRADRDLFGPNGPGIDPEPVGGSSAEPPPPPLTLGINLSTDSVNEDDGEVTMTASFNREVTTTDGARNLSIDWGEGEPESATVEVGQTSVSRTHTYLDDRPSGTAVDPYEVVVTDTHAGGTSDAKTVLVRNLAPTGLELSPDDDRINENDTVALTVRWSDEGVADTHKVRLDWGDGSAVRTVKAAVSPLVVSHKYLDDRAGDLPDDYTISVKVTDDDIAFVTGQRVIHVDNVAPSDVTLTPTTAKEDEPVTYTVGFSDPGTLDRHVVSFDFNDDGTFDKDVKVRAGARGITTEHTFDDDDPTGTPQDAYDVRVRVSDDDGGVADVERTVTVQNVAPYVCLTTDGSEPEFLVEGTACKPTATRTINEGESVTVRGAFSDPGQLDTHRIVIKWGNASLPDTVFTPRTGERVFSADKIYGDNGDFTITVTVTDDDTGVGTATAPVAVLNVNPTAQIDEAGTVPADGPNDDANLDTPTFLTRAGVNTSFASRSTDPGSDDLTFAWDWDATNRYDTSVTSTKYRVNPPADDGLPSPTNQPRDVTDRPVHKWSQACLYNVAETTTDDDAGSAEDDTWVVVTGTDSRVRAPGFWFNQYDSIKSNKNSINTATLGCYLEIVRHMSRSFNTFRVVNTFDEARDALNTKQTSDAKEIMIRQLMASWMNFAHGSIRYTDLVDTNKDGKKDAVFRDVLATAESVRVDPASTRDQLLAQEKILQSVNGGA